MSEPINQELLKILRCPRCHNPIGCGNLAPPLLYACSNSSCALSHSGFPDINQVPVLVDFDKSILSRDSFVESKGASYKKRRTMFQRVHSALMRSEGPTERNVQTFLKQAKAVGSKPRVLIIGGAVRGGGTEALYEDRDIELIGSDVFYSDLTSIIADGHHLPLADGSIHAVWIQAVLEHVLDPVDVVAEIHRVLVPGGIIYSETPFMQQVHEGAYDFTRFTLSGHRWLFKRFEEIESGVTRGPAMVLQWSIRYFIGSIFGTYKAGSLFVLFLFWLRYFDKLSRPAFAVDGPSGVFFLGKKWDKELAPKDMISYYSGAQ